MVDLSDRTLGVIHASSLTISAIKPYVERYIPEVEVMHLADDTIQRENIKAGPGNIPKVNYYKFVQYAHNLEEAKVDLILLACSTFNRAVEFAVPMINIPMLQIDRTMMELAVNSGEKVGLLATLATTVPSSERLLKTVASQLNKKIDITTVLCEEAFEAVEKGDVQKHNEILIQAIDELSNKVDSIVMAQLSMSALAPYLSNTKVPVYNSGDTGLAKVREMLERIELKGEIK
jgi:aspartate/glutamate racemase